jgi:hypothetical protein
MVQLFVMLTDLRNIGFTDDCILELILENIFFLNWNPNLLKSRLLNCRNILVTAILNKLSTRMIFGISIPSHQVACSADRIYIPVRSRMVKIMCLAIDFSVFSHTFAGLPPNESSDRKWCNAISAAKFMPCDSCQGQAVLVS